MARIATVFASAHEPWALRDMGHIRWLKISEALARLGHQVDIATNEPRWKEDPTPVILGPGLRRVPLHRVDWRAYSVVKTLFHRGFETLEQCGGARHPFLIAKLGSVVADRDRPGIYFHGEFRENLYQTQIRIHRRARYITVLSQSAGELWRECHGRRARMLLVPGGVDAVIPAPGANPYESPVCIFSGNIYDASSQPEANRVLSEKLNQLGARLAGAGLRLVFQGPGDTSRLDPRHVANLGPCDYEQSWNFLQHASAGVVVSAGRFMHNNESTKIYHYLRAGLPVVSEAGFPNDHVIGESGLGFVVPSGDMNLLGDKAVEAATREWDRAAAVRYVQAHHTWDCRALVYQPILPAGDLPRLSYRWFGV